MRAPSPRPGWGPLGAWQARAGWQLTPGVYGKPRSDLDARRAAINQVTWKGTRSGADEVMSIAPGFVIARLGSERGSIELGLDPNDATILRTYFVA